MIRAVIFDFNGVLVDDEHVHFELFREILAQEGVALSEAEYHAEYLGYDDRGCFETALRRDSQAAGIDRVNDLIARKAARYASVASAGLRIFPGATAAVRALARRWPVAICSGALRGEIEFALDQMRVQECVGLIVSAEDTTQCKPHPEGYLKTLEALRSAPGKALDGLEAGSCLVVEDSLAGVASARAAGMIAVGVPHTYQPEELRAAGAVAVLGSLEELTPAWVDATFSAPAASAETRP